ncbi:MAG: ABC-2 family transporter protein [Chloroflexota bacterium]
MRIALALARASLQDALQYRAEAAIWFAYDLLPPVMMLFLWVTVYESQSNVAGFDLPTMLTYTIGAVVTRTLLTAHLEWALAEQVRLGTLSTWLVRPLGVWQLWLTDQITWKFTRMLFLVPSLAALWLWLGPTIGAAQSSPVTLLLALVSGALGFCVCFSLKLLVGMASFWITDVFGLITLYEVTAWVLGGSLLPLDLLPWWLQSAAWWLPFAYIHYVPLAIMLGRLDITQAASALGIQIGWILVFVAISRLMWRRGLARYEAFGG